MGSTDFSTVVVTPRITTAEVQYNEDDVSQIGSDSAGELSIFGEWNFNDAENISLTVEDASGADITNEVLGENDHLTSDADSSTGSGRVDLDLSGEDAGEYTVIFEGSDDLDYDAVVEAYTIKKLAVEPDGPPIYNPILENDGSVYSVGIPGSTNGTLEDIFSNGFDGVEGVYEYDSENNQWQLLTGNDFDRDTEELEAIIILTDGESGPEHINLTIRFKEQELAQPSQRSLGEGWQFTTASTFDDVNTVFERGTTDQTIVLDSFATPRVDQLGTHGYFLNQQTTPYYDFGSSDPPQMNPFKGYFVYVTHEGTHPSVVTGVESRQQADQALNATNLS